MTCIKKIFDIVSANNYVKLNEIANSKNKYMLNATKKGYSLLSRSIETRSQECFDILIENSNSIYSVNEYINGLAITTYYYNISPLNNEYYLLKLLEKNVNVTYFHIIHLTNNNFQLFNLLYNKMLHNKDNLFQLLINTKLYKNNISIFEIIYNDFLNIENLSEYHFKHINKSIYYYAIHNQKTDFLNIIYNNINLKYISIDNINIPSLFFITLDNTFNYFYKFYKTLSYDELISIPNINDLYYIINNSCCSVINNIDKKKHLKIAINNIDKILEFDIKFINGDKCVSFLINHILCANNYSDNELFIELLYYILNNFKIETNPYNNVTFNKIHNSYNREHIYNIKKLIMKIDLILSFFNWIPDKNILLSSYYDKNIINFNEEQNKLIEYYNMDIKKLKK
jgi:hypothetical protein